MNTFSLKRLLLFLLLFLPAMAMMADSDVSVELRQQNTPSGWQAVQLPNIATITASNTTTVTGLTSGDNTSTIQAALNAVPSDGGMVVIPAGTWLCGPITVKSKTVLHLSANCTLKLLPFAGVGVESQANCYPTNGKNTDGLYNYPVFLTNASNSTDIIVEGEGETSVIEGQGNLWWKHRNSLGTRPCLIRFGSGQRFLFRNFKMHYSPGTNLTLGNSGNASNFTVHNIWIKNPASESDNVKADGEIEVSHNTDGMPIWGPYVNIYDCNIDTGDDNVVCDSKAHHIHVWNTYCGRGHGMSIGSYTEQTHDIIYEDITFNGTTSGFRIKTNAGRSGNDQPGTNSNGAVKDIICRNATMTGVPGPIKITSWYDDDKQDASQFSTPAAITYQTPEFCNILFQNITATAVSGATSWKHAAPVYIYGRAEIPIHDITLDNVKIDSKVQMYLAYCNNVKFINGCNIRTNGSTTNPYSYSASTSGTYNGSTTSAKYTVTLNTQGKGTCASSVTEATSGKGVTLPTAVGQNGYTFLGWSTNSNATYATLMAGTTYYLTANTTLYGVFKEPAAEGIICDMVNKVGTFTFSGSGTSLGSGEYLHITPKADATFKNGDKITIKGFVGSDNKIFGVKISTTSSNSNTQNIYNSSTSNKNAEVTIIGTLEKDADDLYLFRYDGTGTTITDVVVERETTVTPPATGSEKTFTWNPTDGTTSKTGSVYTRTSVANPSFSITSNYNISSDSRFKLNEGASAVYSLNVPSNAIVTKVEFTNCSENYYNNPTGDNNTTTFTVASEGATVETKDANNNVLQYLSTGQTITSTITGHVAGTPITFVANGGRQLAFGSAIIYYSLTNKGSLGLVSQSISNGATTNRNGSITLVFDDDVTLVNNVKIKVNGQDVRTEASGSSVTGYFWGLNYGSTNNTITLAANSVQDAFGNKYATPINISFNVNNETAVARKAFDYVVGRDGNINEAIAAINAAGGTERYRVFIPKSNSEYILTGNQSNAMTWITRANVSLIGESQDGVILKNTPTTAGISTTSTIEFRSGSNNNYVQDLTLKNALPYGGSSYGVGVAYYDRGQKNILKNVSLLSNQDTYTSGGTRGYYENCKIAGTVDYICGSGDYYFNACDLIINNRDGNVIVAPSTLESERWGFVFNNCVISKADGATLVTDGNWHLGRPWKDAPAATFLNTKMNVLPNNAGWKEMMDGLKVRFHEYGSKNSSNTLLDLSSRSVSACAGATADNPVLTAAQAAEYTMHNVVGGMDGWDPTEYTQQCAAPAATLSGTTLSWNDDQYASSWIVFKDGEYYANPITNSLALTEYGTYTVRAANAMGGLGEASAAVVYEAEKAATLSFTASVQRGSDATVTKTKDTETHYYNNWGSNTWCAQSYIAFNVSVPEGKQVKSATLKFSGKVNGGKAASYPANVYCLTSEQATAFNYETLALGNYMGDNVGSVTDYRANYTEHSVPVSGEIMQARTSTGSTFLVIFQIGNSSGGAYMYGKASASAPTLDVEFEDYVAPEPEPSLNDPTVTIDEATATFVPTDFSSKTGSKTKDGVSLTLNVEGYNDSTHSNTMKLKSEGNTLTFSSENNITAISINLNSSHSSNITKIKATPNIGNVTKDTENYKYTWTGSAKNVVITFGVEEGQNIQSVYASGIDVTSESKTVITFNPSNTNIATTIDSYDGKTVDVVLERKFTTGQWTTLCLPFNLTTAQLIAAFPDANNSDLAVIDRMEINRETSKGTLHYRTVAHLEANTPVLANISNPSNATSIRFNDVTIAKPNGNTSATSSDGNLTMTGVYDKFDAASFASQSDNFYFIGGGKFYDWSYLSNMNPFTAYLLIIPSNGVKVSGLTFYVDEQPTGIRGIVNRSESEAESEMFYNIAGQRVNSNAKGLLIKNRTKIFRK